MIACLIKHTWQHNKIFSMSSVELRPKKDCAADYGKN
jgi:hypothetical protein